MKVFLHNNRRFIFEDRLLITMFRPNARSSLMLHRMDPFKD
jgi:hypothetical protein